MKTETRALILQLIAQKGSMRPSELQGLLNISPQAIHRHLKRLVEQGMLEVQGSAPSTHYALAGVPELSDIVAWMSAVSLTESPSSVCETREILAARLPRLKSFVEKGLPADVLPLVISATGEIGNNSFDHNLGQWRDVPGCWFESQATGKHLWVCVADRGQGIFQSLARVHPHILDDQTALKAAFETIISGRTPEQRGNGLKFVRGILSSSPGCGLACMSGTGRVFYGEQGEQCLSFLKKYFTKVRGTITLMNWRLQ